MDCNAGTRGNRWPCGWMAQAVRLGEVMRAWREAKGLGMREASKLIGVPLATLGRLERGKPTGEYEASVLSERFFR